jgi:peptidoglycan/LPS O-acetylase OafA/YrhL
LPTTYGDALLAGALIAVVRRFRTLPQARWLSVALLAVACALPTVDRSVGRGLLLSWLALVGVALVVAALSKPSLLSQRPLVFLGSISYGLYVVHVPLLVGVQAMLPDMNDDVRSLLVVGASVVLATASRWWFEEWFLRRKPSDAKDGGGLPTGLLTPGATST